MKNLFMNKTLLTIIVSLILLTFVSCIWFFRPQVIFQRKIGFKLPKSSVILNYDYKKSSFWGEERRLYMKVSFSADDYEKFEVGIQSYFEKNFGYLRQTPKERIPPGFSNVCSWWDMNVDDIIIWHEGMKRGRVAFSKSAYAFVTMNEDGQYFMYIAM